MLQSYEIIAEEQGKIITKLKQEVKVKDGIIFRLRRDGSDQEAERIQKLESELKIDKERIKAMEDSIDRLNKTIDDKKEEYRKSVESIKAQHKDELSNVEASTREDMRNLNSGNVIKLEEALKEVERLKEELEVAKEIKSMKDEGKPRRGRPKKS